MHVFFFRMKEPDYERPTSGKDASGYAKYNPPSGVELGYERPVNRVKPTLGLRSEETEDTDGYIKPHSKMDGYETLKDDNTRNKPTESHINPGFDDKDHVYDEIPADKVTPENQLTNSHIICD